MHRQLLLAVLQALEDELESDTFMVYLILDLFLLVLLQAVAVPGGDLLEDLAQLALLFKIRECVASGGSARDFNELAGDLRVVL